MFNLTRQEKFVLLFVGSIVLAGLLINCLQKNTPGLKGYFASLSSGRDSNSKVNLNKATLSELISLPGIGPELGMRVLDYRNSHNGFKTLEEIKKVKGIASHKFEILKERVTIE